MTTYFKAVRPNGASFHDPLFKWATEVGGVTYHPTHGRSGNTSTAAGYLSVSTTATDCTGMRWPCRLLEVEPVGEVFTPDPAGMPNKRAGLVFRTVRELPAHEVFGPSGEHVVALVERCSRLTPEEAERFYAVWYAVWYAARDAVRDAAWAAVWDAARDTAWDAAWNATRDTAWNATRNATWDATWNAAWNATRNATWALVVRDLIGDTFTQAHYDTLTMPWRTTIGPIHPDDAVVGA